MTGIAAAEDKMSLDTEFLIDVLPGPGQAGSLLDQAKSKPDHRIVVDASGMGEVTAANLQVLLCLSAMKRGQEGGFQIKDPSDAFKESLTLLGVDTHTFESELHS